jgi:hypothetical protein
MAKSDSKDKTMVQKLEDRVNALLDADTNTSEKIMTEEKVCRLALDFIKVKQQIDEAGEAGRSFGDDEGF